MSYTSERDRIETMFRLRNPEAAARKDIADREAAERRAAEFKKEIEEDAKRGSGMFGKAQLEKEAYQERVSEGKREPSLFHSAKEKPIRELLRRSKEEE